MKYQELHSGRVATARNDRSPPEAVNPKKADPPR